MEKLNYYARANAKVKLLEFICRKHGINLDQEPIYLKYLNGKVRKKADISEDIK
jgi:hypothetical protein|tara:strand:+ start:87 stop:248 length:162 start_codon:yes stop_codon:yes gene_type:complete